MVRKLIFDTGVLIGFERGSIDRRLFDTDEVAVAAISVAECRVGIELADSFERASERAQTLDALFASIEVLTYTQVTARHHARLIAHTRRIGRPRGSYDLIIAAHTAETGRVLVSADAAARFGDLPGVQVIQPE